MLRVVVVAAAIVASGVSAVVAQSDPIKARQEAMKSNGAQAKIGAAMMKGEAPFDLAKAKAIFATFEDVAKKAPGLFPPTSKTGEETRALPAIWDHMDDVNARFKKFGDDAADAEKATTDLASFKAHFPNVTKSCGGCHEVYRAKKS
jgi:cytochrome c556